MHRKRDPMASKWGSFHCGTSDGTIVGILAETSAKCRFSPWFCCYSRVGRVPVVERWCFEWWNFWGVITRNSCKNECKVPFFTLIASIHLVTMKNDASNSPSALWLSVASHVLFHVYRTTLSPCIEFVRSYPPMEIPNRVSAWITRSVPLSHWFSECRCCV